MRFCFYNIVCCSCRTRRQLDGALALTKTIQSHGKRIVLTSSLLFDTHRRCALMFSLFSLCVLSVEPSADFSPSNSPLTLLCSRSRRSSSKSSPFKRQRSPPTLTPAGLGGAAAMPHLSLSAPPASSASADFTPMSPSASASPSRTPPMRARRALSFGHDPVSSLPPLSLPPLLSSSSSLPPPDRRGGNGGQFGILGSAPKSDISSIGGGGGGSPLGALEFDAHHGARRGASHAAGGAFRRLNFSSGPRTRDSSTLGSMGVFSPDSPYNPFARSPIDDVSFRMPVQQRRPRHIASQPYKILDAPNLKVCFQAFCVPCVTKGCDLVR